MTHTSPDSGGYALLLVAVAMVVVMALGSALFQHFVVAEAREVEESLADSRAHAAMTGICRYVVNLAQHQKFSTDSAKIIAMRDSLAQLNGASIDGESVIQNEAAIQLNGSPLAWRVPMTMKYPGTGSTVYLLKVNADIIDVTDGVDDGALRLEFMLAAPVPESGQTLAAVLNNLEQRLPGLAYSFNTLVSATGRAARSTY